MIQTRESIFVGISTMNDAEMVVTAGEEVKEDLTQKIIRDIEKMNIKIVESTRNENMKLEIITVWNLITIMTEKGDDPVNIITVTHSR